MNKIKYLLVILISSTLFANTNIIEKNGLKYFSDVVVVKIKTLHSVLNESIVKTSLSKKFERFGISEITNHFSPKDDSQENGLNKFHTIVSEVSSFVGNPVRTLS